jgi:predicted nuclease of predicted toxin-antitoxin system
MKPLKWRLYADNNIEHEIVDHLRKSKMDVCWVAEEPDLRREKDDAFHYRKARELGRYLVTHDEDFWNDPKYPLLSCPGLIILATTDTSIAKWLVTLFRKLIRDYNPLPKPLKLDGVKIRLANEGVTIRLVDHDTQKPTTETWLWSEIH